MKRLGQIMCSIMFAFCMFGFVACGPDDEEVTITSVSASKINDFYYITDTIDFSAINVTVTYSDKTTSTLTKGEFDINAQDAKDDTQFIIDTKGLYGQTAGELIEGEYAFTCVLIGNDTVFNLKTVTVSSNMSLRYNAISYAEPEFVSVFKRNSTVTENDESSFYKSTDYYVGDDNEFIFKPILTIQKNDVANAEMFDVDNYDVNVKVEIKNGDAFDVLNDDTYFSYADFAFQFKPTAIDKTFRITVSPIDFDVDFAGNAIAPVVFTFVVKDGWNAYSALDLGRMSLISDSVKALYNNGKPTAENPYIRPESALIFWTGSGATREHLSYYPIWEEFLTSKGVTNLNAINGLFMHGDISVTADDLPSKFFISEEEAKENNNLELAGSLRDFALLYTHYLENDFLFNGNLFKLDCSTIAWGMSNTALKEYYYKSGASDYKAGHSTVLNFLGKTDETQSKATATVLNVEAVGNTQNIVSGDADKDDRILKASGGLILLKSYKTTTFVENCIAKSWLIAWYAEDTQTLTCLDMDYVKTYDCYNSGAFSWKGAKNAISHAEFKRFGGPVMFNVTGIENSVEYSAGFTVDKATCVMESFLTGSEAWFTLNKANSIVTAFIQTDALFKAYGSTILKDDKLNMLSLSIDRDYLASTQNNVPAEFSMIGENEQKFDLHDTDTNLITGTLKATSYKTPVIMASGGQVAYISESPSMHLEFVSGNAPFTGDLLYVAYPAGSTVAGIVVERYNYTAPSA